MTTTNPPIWTAIPPDVDSPYLLVGCPVGPWKMENGMHDPFNATGSVLPIDKRNASIYVGLQKQGRPFVFADKDKWWAAGGPLPGEPEKVAPGDGNVEALQAKIKELEISLSAISLSALVTLKVITVETRKHGVILQGPVVTP